MSTIKTTFLPHLELGRADDPNCDFGRLNCRCDAGHLIPAVLEFFEIQTIFAIPLQIGQRISSPTITKTFPSDYYIPITTF